MASPRRRLDHILGEGVSGNPLNPRAYRFTCRTSRLPDHVLTDLQTLQLTDTIVTERRAAYVVFGPLEQPWYGAGRATTLAIIAVFLVLVFAAANLLIIALLPLTMVPFIPLFFGDRHSLAVSAIPDDDGVHTLITAHGVASAELTDALDRYFSAVLNG